MSEESHRESPGRTTEQPSLAPSRRSRHSLPLFDLRSDLLHEFIAEQPTDEQIFESNAVFACSLSNGDECETSSLVKSCSCVDNKALIRRKNLVDGNTMAAERDGGSDSQHYQIQSLSRQGSLYNLTLNEVQNHIGEPLLSMNLDDLLKTVFASEANQLSGVEVDMPADQHVPTSGLLRQGSITMPCELSKKTVDEVWRDIQQEHKNVEVQRLGREKQPTLGEMTLEDFLVKAGVVADALVKDGQELMVDVVDLVGNTDPLRDTQNFTRGTGWLQPFQQMATMDKQMHGQQSMMGSYVSNRSHPHQISTGTMFEAVFPEGQINISSSTLGVFPDSQTPGRKRGASEEMVDKLADRRQKRMIKNRESAARSRARKQAYTNELENKVSFLEEENERLKKQKELDEFVFSVPLQEPRYQLRRTSSAPL